MVKAYINDLYLKLLEEQDHTHIKSYLNKLYQKIVIPNTPRGVDTNPLKSDDISEYKQEIDLLCSKIIQEKEKKQVRRHINDLYLKSIEMEKDEKRPLIV